MIKQNLAFDLPVPWQQKRFETSQIGAINFLVGPNGSGKSKFATALLPLLPKARMLGTDRLAGMEQTNALRSFYGDNFQEGFAKNQFNNFKQAGTKGSAIDTIVLLEERIDLRIQVEATLSHLFDRKIILDWDSGNLIARAVLGHTGTSYRFDRDECHGIKELLVLLTHLYNNEHSSLIIDEPELNLHPQYQAFFMQEVRKVAGDPSGDKKKKIVFLVTHSPFILDFRTIEDVQSVISFNSNHSTPTHIFDIGQETITKLSSLVPRLNVHHKQLFFSDNPIFVEGILDAQLVGMMQEARGVSVSGAGSCIIDVGGCEEVNRYLELCVAFKKKAHFLYDLDSLFGGNLRACVKDDGSVQSFLLTAGVGNDFPRYCGELEQRLTGLIDQLWALKPSPDKLHRLVEFLTGLGLRNTWKAAQWKKARVAVLTAISLYRSEVIGASSTSEVEEIEGRLNKIVAALKQRNILLLPGGALERYLPKYSGDQYELTDDAKRQAVAAEIEEMAKPLTSHDLANRYGELYVAVCNLPSKTNVDVDRVLRDYLSRYIHDLQAAITNNPGWQLDQVRAHLDVIQCATKKLLSVRELDRGPHKEFRAVVSIMEMLGQNERLVRVNNQTNAGMGEFTIEST